MTDENKSSVINIMQEMLKKGDSEEKIYATLKDIGVKEEQIKNLLLISKADTFSLLEGEIAKITKKNIEEVLPNYKAELKKEIEDFNKKTNINTKDAILAESKAQQNEFEQKQLKQLQAVTEISANTKELQVELKEDIVRLDNKIEERTIGSTKNVKWLRIIGFIVGLILIGITLFKFATLGVGATVDFMIFYIINIAAAIVIMILSLM